MQAIVLGAGDAFSSYGRASSVVVFTSDAGRRLMVDCGPTTLMRLHAEEIMVTDLDCVLLTHFHGDHAFGLPFVALTAAFTEATYGLAGPVGTGETLDKLMALAYPKLSVDRDGWRPSQTVEIEAGTAAVGLPGIPNARVTAFPMKHRPESLGYRIEWDGKIIAVTGDTEWTDALTPLADGADLLMIECTTTERNPYAHLSYEEIRDRRAELGAKRILLVHRGLYMRETPPDLASDVTVGEDGLRFEF
ncbi:MAG: MBL fold metallo-hydrolase [Planctomycetota bacterium]|jgi:ribonuclease BN (tRNA processing enzyme)